MSSANGKLRVRVFKKAEGILRGIDGGLQMEDRERRPRESLPMRRFMARAACTGTRRLRHSFSSTVSSGAGTERVGPYGLTSTPSSRNPASHLTGPGLD